MSTAKKTLSFAHKTLLAGVGVYDSGRDKAANKFDQIFVDGSAFVNGLLEKGESLETQIQAKLEARIMLQNKISALRAKLGFGNDSRDQQIDALTQRVDSLIEVVAKLAQQQLAESNASTPKKAPVKAVKKTTAKASATKSAEPKVKATAAKTASKKPAKSAAKPAAKRVASKAPAKAATKAAKAND
ncbi:hypothetical protein [uncultured Paraglaciecola sp.]|uniref:hypothetical protein n=1 Tax=uncultured Paraglaciecola sp. TaxID=1765024 RepID=UPI0026387BBF|nr:hypothetical protein [uncultured Paraglaciecola sp.]